MKASKFIVLVGGILGILSFFLPLVSVTREGKTVSVSAFEVMKGLDAVGAAVDEAPRRRAASIAPRPRASIARKPRRTSVR